MPKAIICEHRTERGKCKICSPEMWARNRYRTHLRNAKNRGLKNELTRERYTWLISRDCIYCGVKEAGGVDRVDSSADYTVENSVPSCHHCNSVKGALPVGQFIAHAHRIATYSGGASGPA